MYTFTISKSTARRVFALAAVGIVLAASAFSCGTNKASQPYNDAPRTGVNNMTAADIIAMPDGFSNLATKCINGERFTVAYHNDGAYAALSVIPADPSCQDAIPSK